MKKAVLMFIDFRPNISDVFFIKNNINLLKNSQIILSETYRMVYYFKHLKKYPTKNIISDFKKLGLINITTDISIKEIYSFYMKIRFSTPLSTLENNQVYKNYKIALIGDYIYKLLKNFKKEVDISLIENIVEKSLIKIDKIDFDKLKNELKNIGLEETLIKYLIKNLSKRNVYIYKDTIGYMEHTAFISSILLSKSFDKYYIPSDKSYYLYISKEIANILDLKLPDIEIIKKLHFKDLKGKSIYLYPERQIFLSDTKKEIENKVFSISSDSKKQKNTDKGNPDKCNVYAYMANFLDCKILKNIKTKCQKGQIGCVECRKLLYSKVISILFW